MCTVVGANLCVPRPLEINCKGISGVGRVAGKVSTLEHYFLAAVLCSSPSRFLSRQCLGLVSICVCFPFNRK
jgi:hypothetical protein